MNKLRHIATIGFILVTVFILFFHPIASITEDLGRHLVSGKLILTNHQIVSKNLFSYTYPFYTFTNVYWLSEVLFSLVYTLFSFSGLLLLTILLATGTFFILLLPFFKKSSISLLLGSSLLLGILLERTEVRPEIFSYLFLSIFAILLFQNKRKPTNLIFLLIPLTLFWTNAHVYFILGLGLLCFYCLDGLFYEKDHVKNWLSRKERVPLYIKNLFLTTIASFFISLCNPYGISLLFYPFLITKSLGYTPLELQNTFALEAYLPTPAVLFFKIAIVILFFLLLVARRKTTVVDWIISISFTFLGISAIRNINLFVIAIFPIFITYLTIFLKKLFTLKIFIRIPSFYFLTCVVLSLFSIFLLLFEISFSIQTRGFGFGLIQGSQKAVNFFEKNHLPGPIFNNFTIGGYLIYRLYPKEKVFVDNRAEAYPPLFFEQQYIPMSENKNLFNQLATSYGFKTILITHTDQSPIIEQLSIDQWILVYVDGYSAIFVKNSPQESMIIKKLQLTQKTLDMHNFISDNNGDLLQIADFFDRYQWKQSEVKIRTLLVKKGDNDCYSLSRLLQLLPQNDFSYGQYLHDYQLACH